MYDSNTEKYLRSRPHSGPLWSRAKAKESVPWINQTVDTMSELIDEIRRYWEDNPLCASAIPHPLGSKEYFDYYNQLREQNESLEYSYALHEYNQYSGCNVLDIGCGNGYVLSKYAEEGANVYGVDITQTSIDLC